jgi:hypothetical protein
MEAAKEEILKMIDKDKNNSLVFIFFVFLFTKANIKREFACAEF